jgi:hypothetical protein
LVLLVLFAMYGGAILSAYAFQTDKIFADFFGFWSAARFLAGHAAMGMYDRASLVLFQNQLYPMIGGALPFIYPPLFLLIVWPLGLLSYGAACALWIVLTLALYVTALCAPVWRRPIVAALLVVPSTTIAIFFGQSGVLAAALIIGGLRLLKTRPVLAAALLGLAAFNSPYCCRWPWWRRDAGARSPSPRRPSSPALLPAAWLLAGLSGRSGSICSRRRTRTRMLIGCGWIE